MTAEEACEVIRPRRGVDDGTVEAAGPLSRSENIPQRDVVRRQDFFPLPVGQR
jgi:hypothetical protein